MGCCSLMEHIHPSDEYCEYDDDILMKRYEQFDEDAPVGFSPWGEIRNHPSDGDELLTMKVIKMIKTVAGGKVLLMKMIKIMKMIATVAGGGGAILDDDILSAESEAVGRS